jgi:hypothetical protein
MMPPWRRGERRVRGLGARSWSGMTMGAHWEKIRNSVSVIRRQDFWLPVTMSWCSRGPLIKRARRRVLPRHFACREPACHPSAGRWHWSGAAQLQLKLKIIFPRQPSPHLPSAHLLDTTHADDEAIGSRYDIWTEGPGRQRAAMHTRSATGFRAAPGACRDKPVHTKEGWLAPENIVQRDGLAPQSPARRAVVP